jgi:hypothetical protein
MKARNQSSANKSIQGELPQIAVTHHAKNDPETCVWSNFIKLSEFAALHKI